MKLLHIIASPRDAGSHTLAISEAYLDELLSLRPDIEVDTLDLYHLDLPAIAGSNIEAKYMLLAGQPLDPVAHASWREIESQINRFLAADAYLISTPMWNLSVPYALKYYIDCLVQPGYAFRYDETGQLVPLILGRSMVCVTSRGADYRDGYLKSVDFLEPYLRAIFGMIGITDIDFVNAQPMDYTPDLRAAAMDEALNEARTLALRHAPEGELAS